MKVCATHTAAGLRPLPRIWWNPSAWGADCSLLTSRFVLLLRLSVTERFAQIFKFSDSCPGDWLETDADISSAQHMQHGRAWGSGFLSDIVANLHAYSGETKMCIMMHKQTERFLWTFWCCLRLKLSSNLHSAGRCELSIHSGWSCLTGFIQPTFRGSRWGVFAPVGGHKVGNKCQ